MADPLTAGMQLANTGIQAGQAIGSGIKGADAAGKADASAAKQQGFIDQLGGFGAQGMEQILGALGGFSNPDLAGQIFDKGQAAATGLEDLFNGGAEQLGLPSDILGAVEGILGTSSQDTISGMVDQLGGFSVPDISSQLDLDGGTAAAREFGVDAPTASQFNPTAFDFSGVDQLQGQAIATGEQAAERARTMARGQSAQAVQDGGDALNAQLASRGISANSGVGAAALGDFAGQALQQNTMLNSQLADQAGQTALQFGQLDINSGLQAAGMQSQDNQAFNQLGMAANNQFFNQQLASGNQALQGQQLQSQFDLGNAANYLQGQGILGQALGAEANVQSFLNQNIAGLAGDALRGEQNRAGALSGLQGQLDERLLSSIGLGAQGLTGGLDVLQNLYQQNYLNPQMGVLGMLDPTGTLATALGGQGGLTQAFGDNAAAGGTGKGAATAGAMNSGGQAAQGKGAASAGGDLASSAAVFNNPMPVLTQGQPF